MIIKIDPSGLKETTRHEYAQRFVAGGMITVLAGVIARRWGLGIGGLFLAFPAIFPASTTLIQKHERQRKQRKGCTAKSGASMPPPSTPGEPPWHSPAPAGG
jgi:hypothetical protein